MLSVSVISVKFTGNKELFMLLQRLTNDKGVLTVPIASLVIERDSMNGLFIESLDTTGLFQPRNLQTFYVQAFILFVVNLYDPDYLETFSHPKSELVFLKSSTAKKILAPKKLLKYWQNVFHMMYSNVMVHSNYHRTSILFDNIDQFHFFDDDPKSKTEKVPIDDFLMILLQRKDFVEGGIVVAVKDNCLTARNAENYFVPNEKKIKKLSKCFKIGYTIENDVYDFLSKIRTGDYSSHIIASESIEKSVDLKCIQFQDIPLIIEEELEKICEEPVIVLQPRKKK
ncbi:hypothetical protein THOM_2492 [Trachipleistophora hominis]|uniref:Uncharacterized protein n=1 Tax=Trachipleistophora hominis TaxID=72359 RepID=L7JT21_TRAHO|nr:hypothetical protein THOM_2492 [Trachipleistophora hominis]